MRVHPKSSIYLWAESIMHKLALDNDADLVRYAMHQGIVS